MKWFKRKKKEEPKKSSTSNIQEEVVKLLREMVNEWLEHNDDSRFNTIDSGYSNTFEYVFNDGRKMSIEGHTMILLNYNIGIQTTYTLGNILRGEVVSLINTIIRKINERISERNSYYEDDSYSYSYSYYRKETVTEKSNSHPKFKTYTTLLETIENRKVQLSKMTSSNPEKITLENELNAAIKAANTMKNKYSF